MARTGIPTGDGGVIDPREADTGGGDADGGGGDPVNAGGFGEELGGDPAGDADRDTGDGGADVDETGPGPGGTGIPGAPRDQQPDTDPGVEGEPMQPPGAGPETIRDPEPTQGVEIAGSGVARRARMLERRLTRQTGLNAEHVRIRRTGDTLRAEPTVTGRRELQAQAEARQARILAGLGSEGAIGRGGGGRVAGPRVGSTIGRDERGGQPFVEFEPADEDSLREARGQIEQQLEAQLGTDLDPAEDIEFEREDGRLVGRPTESALIEARVESEPLVQLTQGTPLGGVVETGARFGVEQELQRSERREALFDEIGQAEAARELAEDIGLGGRLEQFEDLQADAQANLEDLRADLGGVRRRLETAAAITGVALPARAFDAADIPPPEEQLEQIPDPREEPEAAIALGVTGVGIPEPGTSVGGAALAAGGALALGSQFVGREVRRRQADIEAAQAAVDADISDPIPVAQPMQVSEPTVTAQPSELFPPEQELPEDRSLFVSEQEAEPPSIDLPELLTPVEPSIREGAPAITPPEIEAPSEPATEPFPDEIPLPDEPAGEPFVSEIDLPTLSAAQVIEAIGETRQRADRERRRRRARRRQVPEELLPDGPVTIGGTGEVGGDVFGETPGPRFVFRPDPRSMELRRVETEFGGFRLDPEFSRVLEAQSLEAADTLQFEPFGEAGTLPPAEELGSELAAAQAAEAATEARERSFLEPFEDTLVDEATRQDTDPGQAQVERQATDARSLPRSVTEFAQRERFEGLGEPFLTGGEFADLSRERFMDERVTQTVGEPRRRPRLQLPDPDEGAPFRMMDEMDDFERRFEFDISAPEEVLAGGPGIDDDT